MTPDQQRAERKRLAADHAEGRLTFAQFEAAYSKLSNPFPRAKAVDGGAAIRPRPRKLEGDPPPDVGGYARLPGLVYRDRRMSDSARRLVALLVQWARGRRSADAYIDQLADALGLCRRAVQYAQARAESCGYLVVERLRTGSVNDANRYHLATSLKAPDRPAARRRRGGAKSCIPQGILTASPSLTLPRERGRVDAARRASARRSPPGPTGPPPHGGLPEPDQLDLEAFIEAHHEAAPQGEHGAKIEPGTGPPGRQ